MADIEYYDEPRAVQTGGFGITQWIGAACSLALVLGMIVWAVQLTMRNVAEVPVIQSLEGPMRVRPDDPGGAQAAYQGFAVNDIKAGGAAAPAPESIVLAPAPIDLEAPAPAIRTTTSTQSGTPSSELLNNGAAVSSDALASLLEGADTLGEVAPSTTADQANSAIPASIPGVRSSPRPSQRPANLRANRSTAAARPAVSAPTAGLDVSEASVAAGTRLVQLGAFDDPDSARREWDRLYTRFGDYMEGKQRLIQMARSGGRDFYRLRVVGFGDANDARRFCSAFLAQNAACIPVVSR